MKILTIYVCLVVICYSPWLLNHQSNSPEILITITNTAEQTTLEKAEATLLPCNNLAGKQLVLCMSCLPNNLFKKQFFTLNAYARKEYLMLLTRTEHLNLLQRFIDEQEWHNAYTSLTPEERNFLPKTLYEQLCIISNAENMSLFWKKVDCFFSLQTNPCPSDFIEKTIEEEYQRYKKALLDRYAYNYQHQMKVL